MKIGVKTGPENWREPFQETDARYCEVWFRVDWKDRFQSIFQFLRGNRIEFGLHFWAVLPGGYEPNLAFEPDGIADQTQELIKRNIDIAKEVGATYVNAHPGALYLHSLNLDRKEIRVLPSGKISEKQAWQSLLRRARELSAYAKENNVLFLLETLPKNEPIHYRDITGRLKPQEAQNISPEQVVELAKAGILVTNDFGHTASSWVLEDREELFRKTLDVTQKLAPQTKLIHMNTVIPPFNGTDSHNGVLEKDFKAGVFPNEEELKKLLQPFKERDDVWIIPEPEVSDMAANYYAIKDLVKSL